MKVYLARIVCKLFGHNFFGYTGKHWQWQRLCHRCGFDTETGRDWGSR